VVGASRLRQLVAYARKVYGLRGLLGAIRDGRQAPRTSAPLVAATVLFSGLLRIRSFNALEPKLAEPPFLRLVHAPDMRAKLCSADVLGRSLRSMDPARVRAVVTQLVATAERNKVVREGWYGALRYVALDGWEPIQSAHRHCPSCLTRRVRIKTRDGTLVEVEQYYHAYVVAMLLGPRFDLVLDYEPLLPSDLRAPEPGVAAGHEGELTAGKRLLRRVKQTYGWLDVVVADALYANGPFLRVVAALRMGAVVIAKKPGEEPLREALALWGTTPPEQTVHDEETRETLGLWDCPGLTTLDSYPGPIRVVRARVQGPTAPGASAHTWCALVTGQATRLPAARVVKVARARWHLENTGFHQFTTRWRFTHVFVYDGHAIAMLFWLFFAAFNLLTLFLYRQLRSYGRDRGTDPTRTISRLVDEMLDDLARLTVSPWDTS
jgi:Transposase DDE domain